VNEVELVRLEQRLERRLAVDPPPALRARVARRVAAELKQQRLQDSIAFAAAMAAALVLWANLSWTASRNTTILEPPAASDATIAAQIRDLLPDLSEAEARWQTVVLTRAAQLPDGNATRRAAELGVTH
jgi:hypothetical protein